MKNKRVIYLLGITALLLVVMGSQFVFATTTIGNDISTSGSITVQSGGTFSLTSQNASNVISTLTLGNDDNDDMVGAFEANVISANTGDQDTLSGFVAKSPTSPDSTVREYGVLIQGPNWDYGIVLDGEGMIAMPGASDTILFSGDSTMAGVDRTAVSGVLAQMVARGPRPEVLLLDAEFTDNDANVHTDVLRIRPSAASGYNDNDEVYGIQFAAAESNPSDLANANMIAVNVENIWDKAILITNNSAGSGDGVVIDIAQTGNLGAGSDAMKIVGSGNASSTSNLLAIEQTSGSPAAGSYALYINAAANAIEAIKVDAGNVVMDEDLTVSGTTTTIVLTVGSGGTAIAKHLSFLISNVTSSNIAAGTCGDYASLPAAGSAVADTVIAVPDPTTSSNGIEDVNLSWMAIPSAASVTIRACNFTAGGINADDDQEWRVDVWKH